MVLFSLSAKYWGNEAAILSLVFMSLAFYGYWNPYYLFLIIGSMAGNFWFGRRLGTHPSKAFLTCGIAINLILLGYYKYAGFLVYNLSMALDANWSIDSILLPLAISFFTFQQIAYLVDSYKGITHEYNFMHYSLFVTFFPQLIAGPIVHHNEMLPQFESKETYRIKKENLAIGLSIFAMGLFKKTVLADGVAAYASPVFAAVDGGQSVDFFSAWGGALAYTFQLYFDFSGYSDMAIGLARIFGIILPLNFYSPYKASNISEFWRRWHMTLSRFLRDYVYIPLGGNRHGDFRRYTNLFTTMLLGGLWHGAGWNFVIWGALHGLYLTLHQFWLLFLTKMGLQEINSRIYKAIAWLLTFCAVVVGWVFFRATTFEGAIQMLQAMTGGNGINIPSTIVSRLGYFGESLHTLGILSSESSGSIFVQTWLWILLLIPVTLILPNTQDIFVKVQGSLDKQDCAGQNAIWPVGQVRKVHYWRESSRWAFLCGLALSLGLMTLTQVSEFLYFQF
jgi:alginate O-acetyltransferase complex protein AlgI